MTQTIKDATVKLHHHELLRDHLADFLDVYNFARRLKTLSGSTPYEYLSKIWVVEQNRFTLGPTHQILGPRRRFKIER